MSFTDTFISARNYQQLLDLSSGKVMHLHIIDADPLLKRGFISPYLSSRKNDKYVITPLGMLYLEYYSLQEKNLQHSRRIQKTNIRISIFALLISIASLIVSLAKLLMK